MAFAAVAHLREKRRAGLHEEPAACSTLAAAILTFLLFASASAMSESSTGSLNCFHQSVLAVSARVLVFDSGRTAAYRRGALVVGADHAAGQHRQ